MQLHVKFPGQPFGRTPTMEWPGGPLLAKFTGNFVSADGVGTAVKFHHEVRRALDGIFERGAFDGKTFREPGTYELRFPPGRYWFEASGPTPNGKVLWSVELDIDVPAPKQKAPTVEQRIAALEAQVGAQ